MTAALIGSGVNPYLTLPAAFCAGALAGVCTGLIHVKGKSEGSSLRNYYDDSPLDD